MSNIVAYTFVAGDKFTQIARNVASETASLKGHMGELRTEAIALSGAVDAAARRIRKAGIGMMAAGVAFGAAQLPFLKQFAEMEKMQVAFEQIVGSAEEGRAVFKDLQDFQKGTPFDLVAVKNAAQTLLTFGSQSSALREELTALGNIAASSGGSIEDLAGVFGKAQTAGRVSQDVINSLALRGVNVMQIWSEQTGASIDQIRKAVSKGQVPFAVLRETILDLGAREGGRLTGIMSEQAERLAGAWSRFGGAITLARAKLGGILSAAGDVPEMLNAAAAAITAITEKIVAWANAHPVLMKIIARLGTVLIVLGFIVIGFSVILQTLATVALPLLIVRFLGFRAVLSLVSFALPALGLLLKGIVFLFGALATASLAALSAFVLMGVALFLVVKNFREIKLFFHFLVADIMEFVGAVPAMISGVVSAVIARIAGLKEAATGFLSTGVVGEVLQFFGVEVGGGATVDVQVSLAGPPGSVERATMETKGGGPGLNTGLNMAPGLA